MARTLLSLFDGASREEWIEPEALAARESEGEGEIEGSGERSQVERGALSLLAARGRETRERVQGIEREA